MKEAFLEWYSRQSKRMQTGLGCLTLFIGFYILGVILGPSDDTRPVADAPAVAVPTVNEPAATSVPTAMEEPTEAPTDTPVESTAECVLVSDDVIDEILQQNSRRLFANEIYAAASPRGDSKIVGAHQLGDGVFSSKETVAVYTLSTATGERAWESRTLGRSTDKRFEERYERAKSCGEWARFR